MKTQKYVSPGTVTKFNRKIAERGKRSKSLAHISMTAHFPDLLQELL